MSYRVSVKRDLMSDGVAVSIAEGRWFFTFAEDHEYVDEGVAPEADRSLTLPDDMGRVLMDALVEYYGGTSVGRTLRADYEHERGRVDKMLDYLTERG